MFGAIHKSVESIPKEGIDIQVIDITWIYEQIQQRELICLKCTNFVHVG